MANYLENLSLTGTATYQVGQGNDSNNVINGSTNNGHFFGGQGNDTLTGGVGQDVQKAVLVRMFLFSRTRATAILCLWIASSILLKVKIKST
jgi:hypothetical protein